MCTCESIQTFWRTFRFAAVWQIFRHFLNYSRIYTTSRSTTTMSLCSAVHTIQLSLSQFSTFHCCEKLKYFSKLELAQQISTVMLAIANSTVCVLCALCRYAPFTLNELRLRIIHEASSSCIVASIRMHTDKFPSQNEQHNGPNKLNRIFNISPS